MNINIPEGRRVIRPLQVVHILCMFVFCGCQFVLLFFLISATVLISATGRWVSMCTRRTHAEMLKNRFRSIPQNADFILADMRDT